MPNQNQAIAEPSETSNVELTGATESELTKEVEARLRLEQRLNSGANWFLWIAVFALGANYWNLIFASRRFPFYDVRQARQAG